MAGVMARNAPLLRQIRENYYRIMEYTVYIIYSSKSNKYYVGQTDNFEKRLLKHNSGLVKSTKYGLPWQVVHIFSCIDRSSAMILETKIKNRGISRYLSDNNIVH
jgi:putative endonuclease